MNTGCDEWHKACKDASGDEWQDCSILEPKESGSGPNLQCMACCAMLSKDLFSKTQRKKGEQARCKTCVDANEHGIRNELAETEKMRSLCCVLNRGSVGKLRDVLKDAGIGATICERIIIRRPYTATSVSELNAQLQRCDGIRKERAANIILKLQQRAVHYVLEDRW